MLDPTLRAFYPMKPALPLLEDTIWKFRHMITFRDEHTRRLGLELICIQTKKGWRRGWYLFFPRRIHLLDPIDCFEGFASNCFSEVLSFVALRIQFRNS